MRNVKPKQQRSIETKSNILEAAIRIFARKGPDGARVDEIASAAGINKQRIYAYFGSKSRLYHSVLVNVYTQAAHQEKIMNLTEADLPDLTIKLISAFLEFHNSHPDFWKLLSWENISGGHNLKSGDWEQIRGSYISHIEQLYNKGLKQGLFRKDIKFSTYIMTIFSATYFYYSNRLTISQLLNLDLDTELTRRNTAAQISLLLEKGIRQ
jgi:TetR/AcrR family transcriptional regulator